MRLPPSRGARSRAWCSPAERARARSPEGGDGPARALSTGGPSRPREPVQFPPVSRSRSSSTGPREPGETGFPLRRGRRCRGGCWAGGSRTVDGPCRIGGSGRVRTPPRHSGDRERRPGRRAVGDVPHPVRGRRREPGPCDGHDDDPQRPARHRAVRLLLGRVRDPGPRGGDRRLGHERWLRSGGRARADRGPGDERGPGLVPAAELRARAARRVGLHGAGRAGPFRGVHARGPRLRHVRGQRHGRPGAGRGRDRRAHVDGLRQHVGRIHADPRRRDPDAPRHREHGRLRDLGVRLAA